MKQIFRSNVLLNYITGFIIGIQNFFHLSLAVPGKTGNIIWGIFWLAFYFVEPWAFNFKVRILRVRALYHLTGGNPESAEDTAAMGTMVFFGFLIRLVFRFLILIVAFTLFGIKTDRNDKLVWVYIVAMLFELFSFIWPLISIRLGMTEPEEKNPDKKKADAGEELNWRKKYFPLLSDPAAKIKEAVADILLSIYALFAIRLFWNMVNSTFISYVVQSAKEGGSFTGTAISVAIPIIVLLFFFLIPVRLAYWIGENIRISNRTEKAHYYLSLFVSSIFIVMPTIQTLYRSFFFKG